MNDGSTAFRVLSRVSDCSFLTGPTASGKTGLGVELARRLNAEIVSLDSMAIYRGMDIGTAKPTLDERGGIKHHLIDVVDPCDEFSLAAYVLLATQAVQKIKARGRNVLFVGGSPLYLKGMLRGMFDGPGSDPEFRRILEEKEARKGPGTLHHLLEKIDPDTAKRLHPNDLRRTIRALEVYEKTGKPISVFQHQFDRPANRNEVRVFVLDWNRELLYGRIDRRVDLMMQNGFPEEVERLLAAARPPGRTASQAVGYRELIAHLHGKMSLPDAIDRTKQLTRNFAKSQGTWFRSLQECEYVPVDPQTDPIQLAERLALDINRRNAD